MARQSAGHEFEGTVDGVCFYKMNGKHYARRKSSLTGEQFRKRPEFVNSRKTASEFGRATSLSQLYRHVAWSFLYDMKTGYMPSYLTGVFQRIIQSDELLERGDRKLLNGQVGLLKGFELAKEYRVSDYVESLPTVNILTEDQVVEFGFRGSLRHVPQRATHFSIRYGVVLISEDGEKQRQCWDNEGEELIVPIEEGMDHLGKVRMAYEQKYEEVLVTALMGIRYYQVGADGPVQLKEGACGVVLGASSRKEK
ncbi:hypothetical protein KI659_18440 [Litoribacter alkaliphilus]|uniref:Uncharacterized protein n=1 Tax=Litoribacter ruber TaxID=702568 RepID=A0AAP2CNV1_9BACT|nr:hypothetical protein [Litoribacter alkaliphilus]MBS9526005.1 hypothetical protein [Litoribacter alkaliphilus]